MNDWNNFVCVCIYVTFSKLKKKIYKEHPQKIIKNVLKCAEKSILKMLVYYLSSTKKL